MPGGLGETCLILCIRGFHCFASFFIIPCHWKKVVYFKALFKYDVISKKSHFNICDAYWGMELITGKNFFHCECPEWSTFWRPFWFGTRCLLEKIRYMLIITQFSDTCNSKIVFFLLNFNQFFLYLQLHIQLLRRFLYVQFF